MTPLRAGAVVAVTLAACSPRPITDAGADVASDMTDARDATSVTDTIDVQADAFVDVAPDAPAMVLGASHSSSIAIDPSGTRVFVVNADADSVSIVNVATRALDHEILLGATAPHEDATTLRFDPAVMPRALALSSDGSRLYVTGERSSELIAIDVAMARVVGRVAVGSEPAGVVLSPDEHTLYVACSNDGEVVRVDAATLTVSGRIATRLRKPWGLARSRDGATLYVSHLLDAGLTPIDTATFTERTPWPLPHIDHRSDDRLAYGEVRGEYDVAVRPGSNEVWSVHLLLATETPQPLRLKFDTTVFPGVSVFGTDGTSLARLSTDAPDVPGIDGAIGDVVSGPHAIEFTRDGRYALVVDTNSEDVLVLDANARVQSSLVRPLPGHMPEGIVLAPDGLHAYVDERNTADIAVLRIDRTDTTFRLAVDGSAIPRVASDPMPVRDRDGQRVFFSANSDQLAITQNHWVACASCHIEGRSDAVVWQFAPGPRDTPSNASGTLGTGFLFHTADRRLVHDYSRTIQIEQGGDPTSPSVADHLDALQDFVNLAIPPVVPPRTDPVLVARGQAIFQRSDVGCASCHHGPNLTDSGDGNALLDLAGTIVLHDVGTCNSSSTFPDVAHSDDDGHPRAACQFDTIALRGLVDSAPYFHDGSAPTLRAALENTRGRMGDITVLSSDELDALIEYLRSL